MDPNENYPVPFEQSTMWNNAEIKWIYHGKTGVQPKDLAVDLASAGYYRYTLLGNVTTMNVLNRLQKGLLHIAADWEHLLGICFKRVLLSKYGSCSVHTVFPDVILCMLQFPAVFAQCLPSVIQLHPNFSTSNSQSQLCLSFFVSHFLHSITSAVNQTCFHTESSQTKCSTTQSLLF